MEITIDFRKISSHDELYKQIKKQIILPDYFGNNLDALYDTITGELQMPLHFKLINIEKIHKENYKNFFELMEDCKNEVEGFDYSIVEKEKCKWHIF